MYGTHWLLFGKNRVYIPRDERHYHIETNPCRSRDSSSLRRVGQTRWPDWRWASVAKIWHLVDPEREGLAPHVHQMTPAEWHSCGWWGCIWWSGVVGSWFTALQRSLWTNVYQPQLQSTRLWRHYAREWEVIDGGACWERRKKSNANEPRHVDYLVRW